jgi:D-glycero-D-manno-heptose 1,7-bisphosphate phosphatase
VNGGRIAVFLDRDGTLNEEVDFLRTPQDLRIIRGAAAAIRTLNVRGIITCVISNQSGIARGFLTEDDLGTIHEAIAHELLREGAHVDRFYFCPHHPTEGLPPYRRECTCRKPLPGMLQQGAQDFGIDLTRSFVIGDRIVDIQAGAAVGATTFLVQTGYGTSSRVECARERVVPDHVVPSLVEAIAVIVQRIDNLKESHV